MDGLSNMEIHELPQHLLCSWMAGHGRFARMGVQGDGSCFFHSVCAITNRNNYLFADPKNQREIAYEFRCDFSKKFTPKEYAELSKKSGKSKSFEAEHDGFCSTSVWADEVMIRYASRALDINLVFLDLEAGKAYCGVHGEKADKNLSDVTQKTGIVAWVNRKHFEPIIRVDNASDGVITTLFEPCDDAKDRNLVRDFMKTYANECAI
jgi:hypothetical protein